MTIILSAKASRQLEELLDHLEKGWGMVARKKFQVRLDVYIKVIKSMPQSFPISKKFGGTYKLMLRTI